MKIGTVWQHVRITQKSYNPPTCAWTALIAENPLLVYHPFKLADEKDRCTAEPVDFRPLNLCQLLKDGKNV
jgi:hypothetical protein